MKNSVFLPKTIRVGYQQRSDTYTGQLAYIIYIDQTNKVRKETSWQSWRNKEITPDDFKNIPTSGFVLNKTAGGGRGWDSRQTYTRVYDPRGFEFEITIPNLLYILENTSSIKGKGLEGEFVYGWEGTELRLIPVDAPDYKEIKNYSDSLLENKSFKKEDLVLGAIYKTKKDGDVVYLGHYPYFTDGTRKKKNPKRYFFQCVDTKRYHHFSSLTNKIIDCVDKTPISDIAERVLALESKPEFCPYDPSKYKYTPIKNIENLYHTHAVFYVYYNNKYYPLRARWSNQGLEPTWTYHPDSTEISYDECVQVAHTLNKEFASHTTPGQPSYRYYGDVDLEAMHAKYPFHTATLYLENGKKAK